MAKRNVPRVNPVGVRSPKVPAKKSGTASKSLGAQSKSKGSLDTAAKALDKPKVN